MSTTGRRPRNASPLPAKTGVRQIFGGAFGDFGGVGPPCANDAPTARHATNGTSPVSNSPCVGFRTRARPPRRECEVDIGRRRHGVTHPFPTAPRLIEDRRRGQSVDNPANAGPSAERESGRRTRARARPSGATASPLYHFQCCVPKGAQRADRRERPPRPSCLRSRSPKICRNTQPIPPTANTVDLTVPRYAQMLDA